MAKILPGWTQAINSLPRLHKHLQALNLSNLPPLPHIRPELRNTVFTHKSFYTEGLHRDGLEHPPGRNNKTYEASEIYGDACLGFLVTDMMQRLHPNSSKGGHTNMRTALINNLTLGTLCMLYELPDQLRTGEHQRSDIVTSPKVAAGLFEAYTWAVMQEHDYVGTKEWIHALLGEASQRVYEDLKAT